jgi:glycosyltransferase involved in cell wall biosynthesis
VIVPSGRDYRSVVTDGTPATEVPRKLGVVTPGRVPHDTVVLEVLRREFAPFEVDAVTSGDLLGAEAHSLRFRLRNRLAAYREFGPLALRRRTSITNYGGFTSHRFNAIRRAVAERFSPRDCAFTFQTESLFDASVAAVPHVVYTFHGILASLDYPGFDRRDVFPASWIDLETSIYRNAALVLTRSEHFAHVLVERYGIPEEKVVCVYTGGNVPPPAQPALDESRYARKEILFVGLRWEVKGGPHLVAAFRRVLDVHPDAKLTIVGCSPELEVPNCRVLGRVPFSDLPGYYERASIFCGPAIREAASCMYIEALSYGLPVVATDFGALPEFVREGVTGYRVRCGDVAALADRLIALLDDPALARRLGAGGSALTQERYNWESTGARIRQNIERTLDHVVAVA